MWGWRGGFGDPLLDEARVEVHLPGDGGNGAVRADGAGVRDSLDDGVDDIWWVSAGKGHGLRIFGWGGGQLAVVVFGRIGSMPKGVGLHM
ncbi:hypothetical protein ACIBSS_32310 [Micromonospora aurantiaca]|uniref:hypothetical protein n=1 Tax=Micromonospora aurantiaca (nom. illeg.) TaxID=47850 RepID=UPI0037ABD023